MDSRVEANSLCLGESNEPVLNPKSLDSDNRYLFLASNERRQTPVQSIPDGSPYSLDLDPRLMPDEKSTRDSMSE